MRFKLMKNYDNAYAVLDNPDEVYEYIVECIFREDTRNVSHQAHREASEAQCWCEMAYVGDEYESGDLSIECVDW